MELRAGNGRKNSHHYISNCQLEFMYQWARWIDREEINFLQRNTRCCRRMCKSRKGEEEKENFVVGIRAKYGACSLRRCKQTRSDDNSVRALPSPRKLPPSLYSSTYPSTYPSFDFQTIRLLLRNWKCLLNWPPGLFHESFYEGISNRPLEIFLGEALADELPKPRRAEAQSGEHKQ